MLEQLVDYFLTQPKRLVTSGQLVARCGSFLLVAGLIAHAATRSLSVVRGMAGAPQAAPSLADLLPAVPTWWVPESATGFGLGALLLVVGMVALRTGRIYERVLRH
jgi:hypothetical protein